MSMSLASYGETRQSRRQRRGRPATIKFGGGIDPHYVLATIVSAEGVRLQLNGPAR
jgi:hypothetical protein